MKKTVLLVVAFILLLVLSNPDAEKHHLAAFEKFQNEAIAQKREKEFSPLRVRESINSMNLTVRNYYIFSCSYYPFIPQGHNTNMEQIEGLGILGMVFDLSEITYKSTIE